MNNNKKQRIKRKEIRGKDGSIRSDEQEQEQQQQKRKKKKRKNKRLGIMFFELEDIKRRHSLYWDIYNVQGWVRRPDSTFQNNVKRGVTVGVTASLIQENLTAFVENVKLLATKYEKPQNLSQAGTFLKEVLKLENYRKTVWNRSQYAVALGTFDLGARLATFRWVNNGWQRIFAGFEFNFMRKIPTTLFAALFTAPFSVPFEIARMAYYGDKTFPKELQRGYSSYFSALCRIPFEEGPYFLFKNSFPLICRNFFQTFTLFYAYDFLKDKASFAWRVGEQNETACKLIIATICTYLASIFSYPWTVTREMVDFWPKHHGAPCTFGGNYRKAAVWLWYHEFAGTYFAGFFTKYFWKQAPAMFLTLALGEKAGLFDQTAVDNFSGAGNNSWEDTFV